VPLAARLIVGGLGLAIILFGLAMRLGASWQIAAARLWPITSGEVTSATLGREETDDFIAWWPIIAYAYQAGGRDQAGTRSRLIADGRTARRADAEAELARYVPGAVVDVHYDPRFPNHACLEIDAPPPRALVLAWFGAAITAVALLFP
jgi:hypothetical protein